MQKLITIIKNCADIIEHHANADVGFVTFGVSAYEAACLGLPTCYSPSVWIISLGAVLLLMRVWLYAWPRISIAGESLKSNIRRFLLISLIYLICQKSH